jgi:hypothetical protein
MIQFSSRAVETASLSLPRLPSSIGNSSAGDRACASQGEQQNAALRETPRSKRARSGLGASAFALVLAQTALLKRHGCDRRLRLARRGRSGYQVERSCIWREEQVLGRARGETRIHVRAGMPRDRLVPGWLSQPAWMTPLPGATRVLGQRVTREQHSHGMAAHCCLAQLTLSRTAAASREPTVSLTPLADGHAAPSRRLPNRRADAAVSGAHRRRCY